MLSIFLSLFFISGLNASCTDWTEAQKIGVMNPKIIKESSGIEWARSYPEILFHINDSGDGPNIYLTDLAGVFSKKIRIRNFFSWDSEDISIGVCPNSKQECFFYGDIGDGRFFGAKIKIGYLPLSNLFLKKPTLKNKLTVTLEGGKDDLEGMAVHTNGDLYLTSKDEGHTNIFRIKRHELKNKKVFAQIVATLNHSFLGENLENSLTTSFDISEDGKNNLLLTYENIIQIDYDLSKIMDNEKVDLTPYAKIIKAPMLPQQEAITFGPNNSLLYTTEADGNFNPILRIDCKE